MKNNEIGKVSIDSGKLPRKRFNKGFDINTTADWGSMQPQIVQMMYPNTKNVCSVESLVRLAPMLAPTFGRVQLKQFHQFVDMEDIYPPFAAMLSKTGYNGSTLYYPTCVPRYPLCLLSLYCLAGAKLSVYEGPNATSGSDSGDGNSVNAVIYNSTSAGVNNNAANLITGIKNHLLIDYNTTSSNTRSNVNYLPFTYVGPTFDAASVLDKSTRAWIKNEAQQSSSYTALMRMVLPLGNPDDKSLCRYIGDDPNPASGFDYDYVDIESADIVQPLAIAVGNTQKIVYLAFRLSSFGKRIRKALLGCGYQIDLQSRETVSMLPLMAYFKAYYDLFGITEFTNYEDTELAKFVQHICINNYADLVKRTFYSTDSGSNDLMTTYNHVKAFMLSLGDCWFTDSQDYISAHQASTTMAPTAGSTFDVVGIDSQFFDPGNSAISNVNRDANIHSANSSLTFNHVSVEMLQRLYRWSNAQSVAGKAIADALRAQGYQGYVDQCKSNFIGMSEDYITINDVVSTSDTYDSTNKSGSILGEYGGRGIGYDKGKSFTFETDRYGYWVSMFTIVPKSGISQGIDGTLLDTEKWSFYNPQFDGLGYQMSHKSIVSGRADFGAFPMPAGVESFGLIPRYSEWKVGKNISNGDFSLRGTRNTYDPYCLDKEMFVGERVVSARNDSGSAQSNSLQVTMNKVFPRSEVPTCGPVWRYVARYPWIGTFDRIFANFDATNLYARILELANGYDNYMPIVNSYDNFLVHMICSVQSFAPMLPIEDTFGTDDDGKFDSSVVKS